jgi:hypothetical protein
MPTDYEENVMKCSATRGVHSDRLASKIYRTYSTQIFVLSSSNPVLTSKVLWTCRNRAAGGVKSPRAVTVWRETLERWQYWQALAQLRQSFCTPGHTKRCATNFAVALVPGCDRSWTDWNTWSRRGAGIYGRGLPARCVRKGCRISWSSV